MTTKQWSFMAALPIIAALAILGFIIVRMATGTEPGVVSQSDQAPGSALAGEGQPVRDQVGNLDLPPKLGEEKEVARSQIIAVGTVIEELDGEFIPAYGAELVTPSPLEGEHGLRTERYRFEVERYIKGKGGGSGESLILQVTPDVQVPKHERMLVMLVPWRGDSYQPNQWTIITESDVLRNAVGGIVSERATLDEYAAHLGEIVEQQAADGPPVGLAIPAIEPGQEISAAHFLGLRDTTEIRVASDGRSADVLSSSKRQAIVSALEEPVMVEAVSEEALAAASARVTFQLADGHVWVFDYNPESNVIIHAPAGLKAQLPDGLLDTSDATIAR